MSDRSINRIVEKENKERGTYGAKWRRSKEVWIPMASTLLFFPDSTDVGSYLDGCPPVYLLV